MWEDHMNICQRCGQIRDKPKRRNTDVVCETYDAKRIIDERLPGWETLKADDG